MKSKILCFLCLLALAGCSKQENTNSEKLANSDDISQQDSIRNSVAYKLLSIDRSNNNVSTNDPMLVQVNAELTEISSFTQLPINVIGDMAWAGTSAINKNGRIISVLDTLDMLKRVLPHQKQDIEIMDAKNVVSSNIAHYGVIRLNTNQTHEVAVNSLIEILEKMKTPEFAKAMNQMMNSK